MRPRATLPSSRFTLRMTTSIRSSMASISLGWLMRPQLMSVMWSSPSMPPRSTNAPKSTMFLTLPGRIWPGSRSSNRRTFMMSRSASRCWRRETTMLRRSSSILRILQVSRRPMKSAISPGRRMSTWLAGRKTGTPMSTSRPPLILRITVPVTTSPSSWWVTTRSQRRMRSALRLESCTRPESSSTASSNTSTVSPTETCSSWPHSCSGMAPWLL